MITIHIYELLGIICFFPSVLACSHAGKAKTNIMETPANRVLHSSDHFPCNVCSDHKPRRIPKAYPNHEAIPWPCRAASNNFQHLLSRSPSSFSHILLSLAYVISLCATSPIIFLYKYPSILGGKPQIFSHHLISPTKHRLHPSSASPILLKFGGWRLNGYNLLWGRVPI